MTGYLTIAAWESDGPLAASLDEWSRAHGTTREDFLRSATQLLRDHDNDQVVELSLVGAK